MHVFPGLNYRTLNDASKLDAAKFGLSRRSFTTPRSSLGSNTDGVDKSTHVDFIKVAPCCVIKPSAGK